MSARIRPGSVVWVSLDPTVGREQAGTRPAVVVASSGYLRAVQELAIVLPATTTDRGWPHHVELSGPQLSLPHTTYAMTEQPRTVSRRRFASSAGHVDEACLVTLRRWLDDFLYQPGAMVDKDDSLIHRPPLSERSRKARNRHSDEKG